MSDGEKKKRGRPKAYYDAYDSQLNIRMSKNDINMLERISKEKNQSKSTFVRDLIIRYLNGELED